MAIELNHTIIPARNGRASAQWLAELFGLTPPTRFGPFWQVRTANGVDLDFDSYGPEEDDFTRLHLAFLVSESDFDTIFERIRHRSIPYWADPARNMKGEINHNDGGRGVYFATNDDHLFEMITRAYGSGDAGSPKP